LFIEVSNNEKFDFLTSNLFSLIVVNGGSITNTQVYQGFHDDKKVEEHGNTDIIQLNYSTLKTN